MLQGSFLGGVIQTLGIVLAFVLFGSAWAGLEARARTPESPYPVSLVERDRGFGPATNAAGSGREGGSCAPDTWLIDGFNVLHAGVLRGRDRAGWWRRPARERLLRTLEAFDDKDAELWVVFDGDDPGEENVDFRSHVVFAPSADDWLVRRVKATEDRDRLAVVTADRQVADRARHHGARVVSPQQFLARCGGDGREKGAGCE